jgi:hypothetical protein
MIEKINFEGQGHFLRHPVIPENLPQDFLAKFNLGGQIFFQRQNSEKTLYL